MLDLFDLLSSPDVNWWTGVVWIIVMFLSALILTAPIHCRASIAETLMQWCISTNLMNWEWTHFQIIFIIGWSTPLLNQFDCCVPERMNSNRGGCSSASSIALIPKTRYHTARYIHPWSRPRPPPEPSWAQTHAQNQNHQRRLTQSACACMHLATYIAFTFAYWSVLAFCVNRTHDFSVARDTKYCLNFRKLVRISVIQNTDSFKN